MNEKTYNVNGTEFTVAELAGAFMVAEAFGQEANVLRNIENAQDKDLADEVIQYAKEHHGYFSEDDIEYMTHEETVQVISTGL